MQKLYLRSLQSFVFLLTISILLCLLPILAVAVSDNIWLIMATRLIRYASTFSICSFVYGFSADKVNLFVVPISFLPLPAVHHFMLLSIGKPSVTDNSLSVWRFSALADTLYFLLPMIIITCLISRYMELQKKKGTVYINDQKNRNDFLIAAVISSLIIASCSIFIVLYVFLLWK